MACIFRRIAATILLASAAASQELSPDVLLLSRITRHIHAELDRTPNYTCLETLARFHNNPGPQTHSQTHLVSLDTVRLEVVFADRREWYGAPGARDLSVKDPVAFIGAGMIGNGAFAMTLSNTLQGGIFTWRGEEAVNGRAAYRYDYRLPRMLHILTVSVRRGSGTVGEEGTLWADKESLDIIRLESHATEIPDSLPLESLDSSVNYARMQIGESDALLAQSADSHLRDSDGVESYNRMDFTHCRAYSATSAITFDAPPPESTARSAAPPPAPTSPTIPALLKVTVQLATPVSSADAVGTLIAGKISGDVLHKGKVEIPNGATVHGRIRRLERYTGGNSYIVGLEFTEVELPGGPVPFFADLLSMDKNPLIQPAVSERIFVLDKSGVRRAIENITLPELPGVASFFFKGASFTLPTGLNTVWRTRGPIR